MSRLGILNVAPRARSVKPTGQRPTKATPCVIMKARPRAMAAVPRVTMSEGTCRTVTPKPLNAPSPPPTASAAATASIGSYCLCTSQPATTAARLAISATERSSSAMVSASAKPSAMMARKLVSRSTFSIFAGEAKFGAKIAKNRMRASPASAVPYRSTTVRIWLCALRDGCYRRQDLEAAGDRYERAGYEGRARREQERDHGRDVFRPAEPPERRAHRRPFDQRVELAREAAAHHRRIDDSGRHRVDADTFEAEP